MSWTQTIVVLVSLLGAGGVGALMKHWLDYKSKAQQGADEVLMELVNHLNSRVKQLERTQAVERAGWGAADGIMRHKMANLKQCFDSLLMLIKTDPDRAAEFVVLVEEMRRNQEQQETLEKATIEAAKIAAAASYDAADEPPVLHAAAA